MNMKKFLQAGVWVLLSMVGATEAFATQATFNFTSSQIVAEFSTDSWNGTTGWLGSYAYGTAGGGGRPNNYNGALGDWQSFPGDSTAVITDFYMRPDNLDGLTAATYSVISQTSGSSPNFAVRGSGSLLPNYLSSQYQGSNSGLPTYIANSNSSHLFAEYGDAAASTNPRYGIFASSVTTSTLPAEYSKIQNVGYSVTLDGSYTIGTSYKIVFYLWGDQLNNNFGASPAWISPSSGSKDQFLGAFALNVTAETPEPGTFALLAAGLVSAVAISRRRKSA